MPVTLAWRRLCIGDACQNGKVATLSNSLFFVFNISFLPNYSITYYGYIVKLYSGVACYLYVSLDIALTLALQMRRIMRLTWTAEDDSTTTLRH